MAALTRFSHALLFQSPGEWRQFGREGRPLRRGQLDPRQFDWHLPDATQGGPGHHQQGRQQFRTCRQQVLRHWLIHWFIYWFIYRITTAWSSRSSFPVRPTVRPLTVRGNKAPAGWAPCAQRHPSAASTRGAGGALYRRQRQLRSHFRTILASFSDSNERETIEIQCNKKDTSARKLKERE